VTDADLIELLGGEPPAGIAALPPAERAELAGVIAAARRQQADDLAASFRTTLKHVPFPLRAIVKKVLFG
jgi:hypothetical protein